MGSKKLQKNKIKQQPDKPKTRKEIRKDKRTNKKQKRKYFFEHKKELKNEYHKKTIGKNVNSMKKPNDELNNNKQGKVITKDNNQKAEADDEADDGHDDDEIESDFELSDHEMEKTIQKINKNKKKILEKPKTTAKSTTIDNNPLEDEHKRTLKKERDISKEMRKQRIKQLKQANEEDDRIISQLEKRLKIDKSKYKNTIPKMFNDGLDYAMELCLPENMEKLRGNETKPSQRRKLKQTTADVDDDDDDDDEFAFLLNSDQSDYEDNSMDMKKRKKKTKKNQFDSDEEEGDDDEEDDDEDDDDEEEDDDESEDNESLGESEDEEEVENVNDDKKTQSKTDNWEDIYGRKRDKHGNIIKEQQSMVSSGGTTPLSTTDTKYIPPHVLRRQNEENAKKSNGGVEDTKHNEKIQRLRKQLKGLLNRLSETNMHRIANDVEKLYMQNSRYDMNTTLTTLILESLIGNVLAQERLVLEHMMLIAVLHANIGSEIGAHFLQIVIEKFYELYQKINGIDADVIVDDGVVENKEFDNVIFIICHLYTFQIFQYNLIYEILNKLIMHLNEKSVECILLILRSIGFSLRKDDPMALKTFINAIQKRANEIPDELKNNSRLHYMLDVLMAIKNNNVNKIPQYDSSLPEHLRKILKSMLINGKYVTTINITMNDLLNVNEHGKWWIVGSAWSGKDQNTNRDNDNEHELLKGSSTKKPSFNQELLDLAKKQRMNTDDRRNVFCILMSAEDYLESFEKLLHLSIKDHKIIPSVIIHCCLAERKFNPYYLVLTQKFCDFNRKYQLAVQFLLWDRIKDIHSQTQLQCKNMAQFLIRLIENGSLPISVLKIIEFNELDKLTLRFVRQIMVGILLIDDDERCKNVFVRIGPSFKLKQFKDGIRVFMHHFLLTDEIRKSFENRGGGGGGGDDVDSGTKKYLLLKKRIEMADLALNLESRVQL